MKDKDIFKYIIYGELITHFFRISKEIDRQFFGKPLFAKAANKTIGPLHLANIGYDIDKGIEDIFSLNALLEITKSYLKKEVRKP